MTIRRSIPAFGGRCLSLGTASTLPRFASEVTMSLPSNWHKSIPKPILTDSMPADLRRNQSVFNIPCSEPPPALQLNGAGEFLSATVAADLAFFRPPQDR